MFKKGINIILVVLIFISFLITLYGIYIIYSCDKKVDNMAIKALEEIDNEVLIEEINSQKIVKNEIEENNNKIISSETAIGIIIFESGKKVAIYNNPTDYNMMIGVGKIIDDSVLNISGNSVLLGHNDVGFVELNNIEVGDTIEIKTVKKELSYQVIDTYVTEKDDPKPYKGSEEVILTLITCYPFVYAGNTPNRYVVVAKPINDI